MTNNKQIGLTINPDITRSDKGILEKFKEIGTCAISDAMKGFNTMHHSIKPVYEQTKFAGNAITVRMSSADNLMLHKAIGLAKEGDIIVVDTCGCVSNSILGEMMTISALKNGVSGIVIDGGIRDILELKEMKAPVFARCVTPSLGRKNAPGEINTPISSGGVAINPGDIIVGDANGIVVVKLSMAEDILGLAEEKVEQDKKWYEDIQKGVTIRSDIEEDLRNNGIVI
ncbi:MAG: hypothetical protein WAO64_04765 [Tissierellaceae bacterium]